MTTELHAQGATRPADWRRLVLVGPIAGLAVAVVARVWMRWITVDPEFSWSGTIAIVVSIVLFFTAQAVAALVRGRSRSRRVVAGTRLLAGVLSVGIFGAAGSLMFPTVVSGSLARWRTKLHPAARVVLLVVAAGSAVIVAGTIVDDHGWSVATVGRLLLFVAIYSVIIAATRPTVSPFAARSAALETAAS